MRTNSTLKEVGKLIKSCKYIFSIQKNIEQKFFSKISLKSLLIILGIAFYTSTVSAQEVPERIGNTLYTNKSSSKTTAKALSIDALAAAAGSIDVANAAAGYNGYTADQLVRNILTSGCLTVNNVRFGYYVKSGSTWTWNNHSWSGTAGDRQLGYYNKATSTFPIDEGLLLATGKISSAMGPNSYTNKSDAMVDAASDPDLTTISGKTMHDAAILEFDFIPDGNLVEFKFVFASEEYLEYVNTNYNDAFGFFLSGFGISGTYTNNAINLAQLPNGDAVTVNNIHTAGTNIDGNAFLAKNATYYTNNPAGSATMEYDGATVVLTATYAVTPGKNYKIKMAIADAYDQKWDAGVFLKAKSFATNTLVINNPEPICAAGTTNITLPAITAGSTSGLTYSYWKDAAATIPFTTPTAATVGTYYIKGLNVQSGCSDIKPVIVSQTNIVITETTASHIDVKCKGSSTGSATVTASGGTGAYTYSWNTSPVQTTATATNLAAGTYIVTVTDAKGCNNTKQIVVTEPSTIFNATTTQIDVICNGTTTGSATAIPSGGAGTYTYSWNTNPVQTLATATGLAAGTYTVTIKDANLCSITKSVTIGQPSAALTLAASSKTDVTCFGFSTGSVTAGVVTNSVGTVTYTWKNASNISVGTTSTVSNLPAGTYTLTVTDNCSTQTNSVIIGQPSAALALAASSKTDVTCFGFSTGSVTAGAVTNSVGTVTYNWKNASNISVGTTSTVSNLPAGTYTLTVTDNCSTQTNSVTIGQPSAALALAASSKTDVTCFGFSTGSVTSGVVTNSVGTVTYTWKNASNVSVGTTSTVSNLPAGTYTLTVTDNCSTQTNSVIIGQPSAALALAASSKTDVTCFGFSTGSVTSGTVTNSVGTVTYSWKNASNISVGTTASVSNLPAGTYTLTLTDNCSTQTNSVIIGQPSAALALAASSKTDVTCFGFSTGSVTAGAVINSVGTVTYSWKNASNVSVGTTSTVSNLPAGTYTLTVTDNCSTQTNSVTIGQPTAALALVASSKTDVTCFGFSTGSVTAGVVTNSVGTVTYTWKNASNVSVGTTSTVSNLPAGTYTLTVTDNCSTQTNSVIIGQPSAALALAASSKTDVTCFGFSTGSVTSGTVTNSVGTVTYNWKNASNVSVGTTTSVSNLPAGTYTLTVTDNCSTQTNSVIIGQPGAALALAASSKTDVTCFGFSTGSVTSGTVTNSVGTVTYNWKNASNVSVGTTASVPNLPAGTYTLTVTDNCSTQTNSVIIGQPSAALALATSSKTDVTCFGFSTGSVTAGIVTNSVGTVTYSWKNASNISVGTTSTVSNLPAGTYTLTVTDNCSTQTNSVIIGQPSAALALATSSKTDVTCFGFSTGTVTAGVVTNSVGTVTYNWKNASNISVGTTTSVSNLPAGTYTLTVTDNCSTQTNSVTIGQPSAALALAVSSKTDVTCFGFSTGSVTAGVVTNSVGTVTYTWKNASNVSVGTTSTVSNLPAGTYTLTVTDNCSTQTNSVIIGQPTAALALAASSKTDVTCFGFSTGSVTAGVVTNSVGTVTYNWKNVSNVSVGTTASVSNLPAGTYTLTVTDNCSTQTNSVTIGQPSAALALAASSKTDVTCFGFSTGSVTAGIVTNSVGTVTYTWKNASNVSVGTTTSVSNLPAGTYTLTVTDNCSTQTNSVTIGQPSAALALAVSSKTDVTCFGFSTGSVTAGVVTNSVGTVTYTWKNASNVSVGTTASVSNLPAGTYTLTVTDNCSTQTNSVTIGQPRAALALAASSKTDVTCFGFSTGSVTAGAVTNSVGTVTYTWKNASNISVGTTSTVSNLPAGTYTLTVTDNCSTQTNSVIIGQPSAALALAASSKTDVTCFGFSTGSVTAGVVTNSVGTVTYSWKNASNASVGTTSTVLNLPAGTYTLTVTDNCSTQTNSVIIGQPSAALSATTSQVNVGCGGGNNGSATVNVSGGTLGYTYSWDTTPVQNSETATGLIAGTYTVIIKDANLCTISKTVTISDGDAIIPVVNPLPVASTINCPAVPIFTTATATDNNGTIASLTFQDVVSQGGCAGSYTTTRTWTAVDACGNISLPVSQVITVQDITAPTWTTQIASLNKTIECSDAAALTSAQALFPIASDLCDSDVSNIVKVSGLFTASADCSNAGTYTNTWTVSDDCGNTSDTFTQVITIQDTSAPTWTTQVASLNKTIECSDAAALTSAQALFPIASDSCDSDVSNIVKVSGLFTASADCSNAGTYTNTWTVSDNCGNTSDTFTQVITIQDTTKPTWTTQVASLNKTIECSDAAALTSAQALFPIASDSCDSDVSNIVKVSGLFTASADCSNAGTYTNTWTVSDDCGNTSDTFTQVITIQDTSAPTWTTQIASLNKTIECSDAAALTSAQALFPIASDSCDSDVSNIVKVSGLFTASADCSNAGTYTNTWTVSDDCRNTSDTFTQVITIQDTSAPTWTTQVASLNKTIECSDAAALTSAQALFPIASDSCDSDVSNIVKVTGLFTASADCSNTGTYTNTWTVSDDCGNTSDTFTQVITIQDTSAPTWTTQVASLNKTIECSDAAALTSAQALFPIASDSCDSDVSNIVKVSGLFTASADCSNAGTYTNTWTVSDNCGNTSDTFTQVITIQDTTKPTFIGELPSDLTVSCDAVPEPANVEASDNCNGNLPIVFSEIKSNIVNECASNYTLTRKWTTSDCSGNTALYTQIITVRDTTAPTGTAPADVANLQTIADIPLGNPSDIKDAADNCSTTVEITVSDSNNEGSGCEGNAYILTRTYTLTDCSGNKTELKQTFTVENKVSVSGIASNVTCSGGKDGSIVVTNSPGSIVIIRNENNEVVTNTNLPAGTYTLTATSSVNTGNQTCSATAIVVITQPTYTVKISGQILNKDTNAPIANVPVTLVPQGSTTGPVLMRITGANGLYNFSGIPSGSYLVQVQDANLNSTYQLYPVDSSLFFTTLEDCKIQQHNFEYEKSNLPVLGDYVWYDTNGNGIQDEWYDANNDGVVTKNIPDENGTIDYSQWEWIDLNGDGSYTGPSNVGELNAGGFGNALNANVIIDGPNGYHEEVIVGIEGFWRDRPNTANPYGDYTIKLVKDANLDAVAATLGASGLVKVLPSVTDKKPTAKSGKSQLHTVCSTTSGASGYIVTVTPEDLVHLNADFGVNCKVFSDIVANDDSAGPIAGVNHTTPNVLNVLLNDTIEGVAIKASDVVITTVTPNEFLQLKADGSVDVLPNAPVGTLTLVYQICEADQTTNCDTATVTITISEPAAPPIPVVATDDIYANIGCNTFGLVGNVLANDFQGITKASLQSVNFTLLNENNNATKTDPNISFDALGNVTVSSLTPAGTYTYSYQICDKLTADNCDTATVTVIVIPNGVTTLASKACNDDSTLIDLLKLLPENTPTTGIWVDPKNSNTIQGNTFNALGLALGNYTFEYRITDQTCPRTIVLNMEVNDDCKVLACGNVVVHNAFSPNGDGINDVFKIDSIDDTTCYPENNVEIYNRWGILVFETENYNNTSNAFDGTSRGRTTVKQSDGLPTGTYFYIVNYKSVDGNNVLQNNKKDGYLYLSK